VSAKFLSDAAWYFYLFWLPKYLYDARGFDIKTVGTFAWIPPAAAGIGCLVGGWFSSYLLQRQLPLDRARKVALGRSAFVMPLILLVPRAPIAWAIALFSLAYFGQQSWSTLVMILPTDIFPKSTVGAVAGLVGFGGAMGGVVFGQMVGYLLDHGYGYGLVFALAGSLHVVAFATICPGHSPHRAAHGSTSMNPSRPADPLHDRPDRAASGRSLRGDAARGRRAHAQPRRSSPR
jgi:ACS family hexuronate transporter-like MFS transporter